MPHLSPFSQEGGVDPALLEERPVVCESSDGTGAALTLSFTFAKLEEEQ